MKLVDDLTGNSTLKRRKAAKKLQNEKILPNDFEGAVLIAFEKEEEKSSWQTLVELLKLVEVRELGSLANYIKVKFLNENIESHSLVSMYAAKAFLSLKKHSRNKVESFWELVRLDKYSINEGVLEYLGYHKIIPEVSEQKTIIQKFFNFGSCRSAGYTDPRYGLAAACAGWDENLVKEFLEDCLTSDDVPLKYVAENSLRREYKRLR